jgi:hypothetical protein
MTEPTIELSKFLKLLALRIEKMLARDSCAMRLKEVKKEIKRREKAGEPWTAEELEARERLSLELVLLAEQAAEWRATIQEYLSRKSIDI